MSENMVDLVREYAPKGVLVDTNILLLFLLGRVDRERIGQFKRTAQFTPLDFDMLAQVLLKFQQVVTTPNVLTEVSNLGGQLTGRVRSEFMDVFASSIGSFVEQFVYSAAAAATNVFKKIGLTDACIGAACKDKYLVLTDDFALAQILAAEGIDVINFNHLRNI